MIETPSTERKPAAKIASQISGRTSADEEAAALVHEAQHLPPHDPGEAAEIGGGGHGALRGLASAPADTAARQARRRSAARRPRPWPRRRLRQHRRHGAVRAHLPRAGSRRVVLAPPRRSGASPTARPAPSSRHRPRTWSSRMARLRRRRGPTVGSSSSSSEGWCSSARAISTRRRWPPDRLRTCSAARSPRPTRSSSRARPRRAPCPRQAVQRRVVEQVLPHRQVGIERAAAGTPRRCRRAPRPARAGGRRRRRDRARCCALKSRVDQREQRGLAGAVRAEQHRELARHDREADVAQRRRARRGEGQALDLQRRRGCGGVRGASAVTGDHHAPGQPARPGSTAHHPLAARSITDTSLLTPLVV